MVSAQLRDRLLTVAQVAKRLNVTERFVRRLVAERRIAIQRVGRHVRFREEDVDAFLEAGYLPRKPWGRA
jgi:excisionase family DNA binding protein